MIEVKFKFEVEGAVAPKFSMGPTSKRILRATEQTLDEVARLVYVEEKSTISKIFDRPTPYTISSLKLTRTKNHNMEASVWFKEPDRMIQHYLVPQVEGGGRRMKGFERALDSTYLYPAKGARLDKYGNMPYGQIVQILSVLGRAEYVAGYSANITTRSRKRNRKPREFFWLRGNRGKLTAGIYERQQKGRPKPVLIKGKSPTYSKRFRFYEIGRRVVGESASSVFLMYLSRQTMTVSR